MADIQAFLTGFDAEDARTLDDMVATIEKVMKERSGLQTLMKYRVAKRDKRDTARYEQFFEYRGPDADTMSKLTGCGHQWMTCPSSFWSWRIDPVGDPRAFVVGAFMQDSGELQDHAPRGISASDTARALCSYGLFNQTTPEKVESTMKDMVNWGHRYKNLEKTLGKGICLVLGTQLSETLWYKILPKSGPKFKDVIAHLRKTGAVEVQKAFVDLREVIVKSKLQELRTDAQVEDWMGALLVQYEMLRLF
ncbi:hypothetical protein M409DRAFT_19352 [Zasmidium cellare ATCC 36951]|uniref:Uncharacterized protein n=1 Tax=Zasmidium cellare ATCC 36951 TaxID=1080233 RepID=A0A6A6CXE8_ZASCE|nr:uncharacterized protein M409DRAFT_19352 [Zasmidium cellare ATCC 36951]KAF2170532.1 hypothetical protein M409DRAFT_19352 [Zasmidium cellare ATCC 36951]